MGGASAAEVEAGVRGLLPGAVMAVDGQALVFRVGPRSGVTLAAGTAGWVVGPHPAQPGLDPFSPEILALEATSGGEAVATALVEWLRSRVAVLPAAEVDPGLAAALGTAPAAGPATARDSAWAAVSPPVPPASGWQSQAPWPGKAASADAWPGQSGGWAGPGAAYAPYGMPPRKRRSTRSRVLITLSIVVGSLLVLVGAGVGIAAAVDTAVSTTESSSTVPNDDGSETAGDTAVEDLSYGDCFIVGDAYQTSDTVSRVDCSEAHDSEFMGTVSIPVTAASGESSRVAYDLADVACYGLFEPYVGDSYNNSDYDYDVLTPSDADWNKGDTTAYCYVTLEDTPTGSVRGSGR